MQTTKDYTLHLICGIILFAALFSCTNAPKEEELYNIYPPIKVEQRTMYVYVIDSCEYIGYLYGSGAILTHKGNCKNHKK